MGPRNDTLHVERADARSMKLVEQALPRARGAWCDGLLVRDSAGELAGVGMLRRTTKAHRGPLGPALMACATQMGQGDAVRAALVAHAITHVQDWGADAIYADDLVPRGGDAAAAWGRLGFDVLPSHRRYRVPMDRITAFADRRLERLRGAADAPGEGETSIVPLPTADPGAVLDLFRRRLPSVADGLGRRISTANGVPPDARRSSLAAIVNDRLVGAIVLSDITLSGDATPSLAHVDGIAVEAEHDPGRLGLRLIREASVLGIANGTPICIFTVAEDVRSMRRLAEGSGGELIEDMVLPIRRLARESSS